MKKDKKIKTKIEGIYSRAKEYLDFVDAMNECAYTDRMIEGIIILSKELKDLYENNFEK